MGKSCISSQATRHKFESDHLATIGFEYFTFNIKLEETIIKLQIWDTCGQEFYKSLISSFYHNASLAVIVYSIDNQKSFEDLDMWLKDLRTNSSPDVKIFLIGNKADLEDKRKVTKEAGQNFANAHNISFFTESSAKTGLNVQNIFIEAAKILYVQHEEIKNRISRPGSWSATISVQDEPNKLILENEDEESRKPKKKCCFL